MKRIDEIIKGMSNEERLAHSKDKKEPEMVYLHVNTLIQLDREIDALTYLVFHEEIYENDPLQYIEMHLDLLVSLYRFQDALDEVKTYQERPYVSMEVEDYLHHAPNYIKAKQAEYISRLEKLQAPLEERLSNYNDSQGMLRDLTEIAENGQVEKYLAEILEIPLHADNMSVRNYAVLVLFGSGYSKDVAFKDFYGNIRLLDMHSVVNPFSNVPFKEVEAEFDGLTKDITINKLALQIFVLISFNMFPDGLSEYHRDSIITALVEIAAELIGSGEEIVYLSDLSDSSREEVERLKPIIEDYMGEPNTNELN